MWSVQVLHRAVLGGIFKTLIASFRGSVVQIVEYLSWASELVAGAPKWVPMWGVDQKDRVKHRKPALRDDALIGTWLLWGVYVLYRVAWDTWWSILVVSFFSLDSKLLREGSLSIQIHV